MKVGVDARLLSKPITGIGRYTLEMCRALLQNPNVELYLYSPAPLNTNLMPIFKNCTVKTGFLRNVFLRQYWSEFTLASWVKQDNLDVFWGPAHFLPPFLQKNLPCVVTIHDLVYKYASNTMRPLSRILESYRVPVAIKKANHIVTDSNATAQALQKEFKINPDRLSIIYNGANHMQAMHDASVLKKLTIHKPYCLFVGTLEPRKNLARLLKAYATLPQAAKDRTNLVVVGGKGWGDVNLKKLITDLKLENHVHLLGYVDETLLPALYTHAQFLAMPSLYEGFGLPLVEAMNCGTPVLTSNNSSMVEVARNAGILVDPLEITSIKNGLQELIMNDTTRQNLAQQTQTNANRFNWQHSSRKLMEVFQGIV